MVIYSSYSNYNLIVILSKGNNDKKKHGNYNNADGNDNEKDDDSQLKELLDELLNVLYS